MKNTRIGIIEVLASIGLFFIGLDLSRTKPAAQWIFGIVAVVHIGLALVLWNILDRS